MTRGVTAEGTELDVELVVESVNTHNNGYCDFAILDTDLSRPILDLIDAPIEWAEGVLCALMSYNWM